MKSVKRREGESVDNLLRRFKRSVSRNGILREYRGRMEYVKPSEQRRKKHRAAVRCMKAKREA